MRSRIGTVASLVVLLVACGDDDGGGTGEVDAGDGYPPVTTAHCDYAPVPATAGAGGTVTAGALSAGAAERVLPIPVSTALGSYTGRANFLGSSDKVDIRAVEMPGSFNPSIGVETAPRVKALALEAGGEKLVILKVDLGFTYEGFNFELEKRLGPEYAGKVMIAVSHSHSSWGQYSAHEGIGGVGAGRRRQLVVDRMLDAYEAAAKDAIAAMQPARIGIVADTAFDSDDRINRDRRGENDELAGGPEDDHHLFMIRVDAIDGTPIAVVPIFGEHGTLMGSDNSFAHTDSIGGVERVLQEQFDRPVVVMHLQGIAGDVSPVGYGGLDCDVSPGNDGDPCWNWLRAEGHGRVALSTLLDAWEAADTAMVDSLELEVVTRSIPLGPSADTFAIRGGALAYAPFDRYTPADREIFDTDGELLSPIDEFNAPVGAALCESTQPLFPAGLMTGVEDLPPYGSCVTIDVAGEILGQLLDLEFSSAIDRPVCQSTRTTVQALRLGDYVIATMPGEITTLLGDKVREQMSPVAADKTVLVGFANGHVGYLLTPEDWVRAGYEPSINFWGPLEAEYIAERVDELMDLVVTPAREDAAAGGADRFVAPALDDGLTIDTSAPMAGTVPQTVPADVWTRTGPAAQAQPAATIQRVSGLAQFVWIGEDALVATPTVTLQREVDAVFGDVARRSGRSVSDGDIVLAYTPMPLRPEAGDTRTHYWVAEWQAVPWLGSGDLDSLDARAAVPAGRYRFKVTSPAYEIVSDPFTVEPAQLHVSASRAGTTITAAATVEAPKGFRLMDLQLPSNRPVPLRNATFTVELTLSAGEPIVITDVAGNAAGALSVDAGADAANVISVTLTDAHGNTGTVSL